MARSQHRGLRKAHPNKADINSKTLLDATYEELRVQCPCGACLQVRDNLRNALVSQPQILEGLLLSEFEVPESVHRRGFLLLGLDINHSHRGTWDLGYSGAVGSTPHFHLNPQPPVPRGRKLHTSPVNVQLG